MEAAGAVFLPAAGLRDGTSVYCVGPEGNYLSSSGPDTGSAGYLLFYSYTSGATVFQNVGDRCWGYSVRLVTNVAPN